MRRLDTQSELVKHQEQATAQARAELLRLSQSQRDTLATSFGDLLRDGGPVVVEDNVVIFLLQLLDNTKLDCIFHLGNALRFLSQIDALPLPYGNFVSVLGSVRVCAGN